MKDMYSEILRYMGHKGGADTQITEMISSCLEKLASASTPRYVLKQFPCTVADGSVSFNTLAIKSNALASHLSNCESAYILAATLGSAVDRLITKSSIIDSPEALCLQACAAAQIEDYCDSIEKELALDAGSRGLRLCKRFSPGYGDFDIAHQTDVLRMLNAQKEAGITETKTHMLSPLKSVTAVIGASDSTAADIGADSKTAVCALYKCDECAKTDCQFRVVRLEYR